MKIARRLKEIRNINGYTRAELSEAFTNLRGRKFTTKMIEQLEANKLFPTTETLYLYVELFNLRISDILEERRIPIEVTPSEKEIILEIVKEAKYTIAKQLMKHDFYLENETLDYFLTSLKKEFL